MEQVDYVIQLRVRDIIDSIMDMHLQALRPCTPGRFVAHDAVIELYSGYAEKPAVTLLVDMRIAQRVADEILITMKRSGLL